MNEYYMNLAIQQAKKAYKYEEVPVGAIIVKNNKIIAKAYNKKQNIYLYFCLPVRLFIFFPVTEELFYG